jgi:hypothetical protein
MMPVNRRIVTVAVLSIVAASWPIRITDAQQTPGDSLAVRGSVVGPTGPVAGRVVVVFPLEAIEGKPVARFPSSFSTLRLNSQRKSGNDPWEYYYDIVGSGPMLNPKTTTNAQGSFSLTVSRSLFTDPPSCVTCVGYRSGELGVGVFFGTPEEPAVTFFEIHLAKFDQHAATVDLGEVTLRSIQR